MSDESVHDSELFKAHQAVLEAATAAEEELATKQLLDFAKKQHAADLEGILAADEEAAKHHQLDFVQGYAHQAAALNALEAPHKGKRRYKPPKADADTFDTQEEFVNSLVPIPISEVQDYNRKCAHCWKRYGESDPNENNAEQPVKFRCGHIFGEQCMKEMFRLPTPMKVQLKPLSFGEGSRGAKLGERLEKYIDRKHDNRSAHSHTSQKELMKTLVKNIEKPGQAAQPGASILGPEWSHLIQQITHTHHHLLKVHLLENGVVYDTKGVEVPSAWPTQPFPMQYNMFGSTTSTHLDVDHEIQGLILAHLAKQMQGMVPSSILYGEDDADWDDISSTASASSPPTKKSVSSNISDPKVPIPKAPTTTTSKAKVLAAGFSAIPASSSTPSAPAPIPPLLYPGFPLSGYVGPGSIEGFDFDAFLSVSGLHEKPPSKKSATEVYEVAKKHLVTLPDAKPLQPLDELKEIAEAKIAAKVEANKVAALAAEKRAKQADDERAKRTRAKVDAIATALMNTLTEYRQSQEDMPEPRLSESPPPLKKLKASMVSPLQFHQMIQATATLHKADLGTTHYNISQPYDSTVDDDSSEAGSDTEADEKEADNGPSPRLVMLIRTLCGMGSASCCFGQDAEGRVNAIKRMGGPPESIGWMDIKRVPDCCPLCKRILFKKHKY